MPQPKKPVAQIRRVKIPPGFRLLPNVGRSGDPPAWPLGEASKAELEHWRELWTLPQAVEWERMRCESFVALYVRVFVKVSNSATDPRMLAELRQLDAKIGLSPRAMLDLRWETDAPSAAGTEPQIGPTQPRVFVAS